MASSLMQMLSQQLPTLQTRKALVLTGLQNDFLSPDGKLPVGVESGFLEKLHELVPAFREFGDVIWVKTQFDGNRPVDGEDEVADSVVVGPITRTRVDDERDDDRESPVPFKRARVSIDADRSSTTSSRSDGELEGNESSASGAKKPIDEELFLMRTKSREPCCVPDSTGADYAAQVTGLMDKKDLRLTTTHYSAFGSNSLLLTLRSRLITELYVGGCMSNVSVFATAMDAARYGIDITLIEDCLGYRNKERHGTALKQLQDIMGAEVLTAEKAIDVLRNPPPPDDDFYEDEYEDEESVDYESEEPTRVADHRSTELDQIADSQNTKFAGPALEVDSEEEDEDLDQSVLKSPFLSNRLMQLQFSSALSSQKESLQCENPPRAAPPKSTEANDADAGHNTVDNQAEANAFADGMQQKPEETQPQSASSESEKATAAGESLQKVGQENAWLEFLKTWDKPNKPPLQSKHRQLAAMSNLVGLDQQTVDEYEKMMDKEVHQRNSRTLECKPLFGDDKESQSRGSKILHDLLPAELAETMFEQLNSEILWQRMHHQTGEVPRLVCCQGSVDNDGSMPVYRHPSDQTLPSQFWTPAVDQVRKAAEAVVGHPLNHALIQLYRSGNDYISEHSDKTLDIVKESYIVNVSFGAQRTMRLRTKRGIAGTTDLAALSRTTYRVQMPHNSMIMMSLSTNAEYLHGINADKRPKVELSEDEKAFEGQRISLTFRNIGTFLNKSSSRIWGQGARKKSKEEAGSVINGDTAESERLIKAFGAENQASSIEWDAIYGGGFDVLHLK